MSNRSPAVTYPALPLHVVEKWVPVAAWRDVSEIARSPRGFLAAYRRAGTFEKLSAKWKAKREAFIARHMGAVIKAREPMFDSDGEPTRRHLAFIVWAYSPERGKLNR